MYEDNNQYQTYSNMPYDNTRSGNSAGGYTAGGNSAGGYGAAPQPEEPESRKKNKGNGSFWKKIGTSAACALVFGAVAGVTMTGVQRASAGKPAETATEAAAVIPETAAETEAAKAETRAETASGAEESKAAQAAAPSRSALGSGAGSLDLDVSHIVEKAMPSVVAIDVKGEQSISDWFGRTATYETEGAGSGILIGETDTEYLVVTNNHVVEDTTSVSVQFIDGESAPAQVKGTDSGKDVAVISVKKDDVKAETKEKIVVAEMGDSENLKVGQGVIAIGNALGYGQSVTVGFVSALDRTITAQDYSTGATTQVENLLQTDAAINPGNSGGALLDMDGKVIGINESKSVDTSVEGMGYAIPISTVKELIQTLSQQKEQVAEEKRGYIGFQGQNVDADAAARFNMPEGIFVYKILEDGAAANSELQENDIITSMDGMTVKTIQELQEKLTRYEKGETVVLKVQRPDGNEYKELEVSVTLAPQGTIDGGKSGSEEKEEQQDPDKQEKEGSEEKDEQKSGGEFNFDDLDEFFRNGGFQFRW